MSQGESEDLEWGADANAAKRHEVAMTQRDQNRKEKASRGNTLGTDMEAQEGGYAQDYTPHRHGFHVLFFHSFIFTVTGLAGLNVILSGQEQIT
jgi:hypothetical protein